MSCATLIAVPLDPALAVVLRRLREQRGESREAVAVRAGIAVGTLARIELGQRSPTWPTLRALCEALEISMADLGRMVDAER
jgi:transcriptional regulator with XRE-family HTH domain